MAKKYRLSLEFNEEASRLLDELSNATGKSKAEVIRQGLILRHFFEAQKKQGKSIAVTQGDRVEKEIILS